MSGWQPIETAPKDATCILVANSNLMGGNQQVVFWDTLKKDGSVYGWCTSDGPTYHQDAFTHWMPLPATPTAASCKGPAE